MIRGAIITNNRPAIIVNIGWKEMVQQVVAIIDTGFTGELKIPPESMRDFNVFPTHTERIELANKSIVPMPACLLEVSLEGEVKTVEAVVDEGDILIGVGLLKKFGYILKIDFKHRNIELTKAV